MIPNPWIIRRTDQCGGYVAEIHPNATEGSSYTNDLKRAKRFPTREAAERERCVENEVIENLNVIFGGVVENLNAIFGGTC